MKRKFGNVITRLLRGGIVLLPLERAVLEGLLRALPEKLLSAVEAQLDDYNLVQREVDGRALNFYRIVRERPTHEGLPELPITPGEIVLLKAAFRVANHPKTFHATMTAVDRRFFCVSFSEDVRPLGNQTEIEISDVKQSWRSSVVGAQHCGAADA